MTELYLSRAQLKRDASTAALAKVLLPDDAGARAFATHRVVWTMFAGDCDAPRDFLYRAESPDPRRGARTQFHVLSRRPPNPDGPLLEVETRPFAPDLRNGDLCSFMLRANATRTRKAQGRDRSIRVDVVMDAIHGATDRAVARTDAIPEAGRAWLEAQGTKSGFRLIDVSVDGYEQWRFPGHGRNAVSISTLDFNGVLEVTDADRFLSQLGNGFGRAKGFGLGLMLIRRH